MRIVAQALMVGSSPRLRGTDDYQPRRLSVARFIPAPAGNSALGNFLVEYGSVHPRACGEQDTSTHDDPTRTGSSPRLRGTVATGNTPSSLYRFIPAPAGNSPAAQRMASCSAVHPRACGEQMASLGGA